MTRRIVRKTSRANPVAAALTAHWERLVGVVSVLTAATTALIYAVTLNANALYAGALGLTTDDLGVTQAGLVANALVFALIVGSIAVLGVAACGLGLSLTQLVGRHAVARWPVLQKLRTPKPNLSQPRLSPMSWLKREALSLLRALLVFAPVVITASTVPMYREGVDGPVGLFWYLVITAFVFGVTLALIIEVAVTFGPNPQRGRTSPLAWVVRALALLVGVTSITVFLISALNLSATARAVELLRPSAMGEYEQFAEPFLAGQHSHARLIPLTASDPLNLCDGKKVVLLISATPESNILIVYPEPGKSALGVYRAPRDTYAVVTGLAQSIPCTHVATP